MTSAPKNGCPGGELVDLVMATQGGAHRPIHTAGIGLNGTFVPFPDAPKVSSAAIFTQPSTPVTVRFSDGVGHLGADQRKPDVRGFAARFHLDPDPGKCLDMIAMTLPIFFTATPEAFEDFARASVPNPETGVKSAEQIVEFMREHPSSQNALGWVEKINQIDVSYGAPMYFSVHAFHYVNEAGDTTVARFFWKPDEPQKQLPRGTDLSHEPPDRLRREITKRARAGHAPGFTLVLQVQGEGDIEDDPSIPWESKNYVPMGHLQLATLVDDQYWQCEGMQFNPTRLVSGIDLSTDPVLAARGDAYHESATRRCMAYPEPTRVPAS